MRPPKNFWLTTSGDESSRKLPAMTRGGLVVSEVTVAFGGLTALDRVSLQVVAPGEVVGVIGPNGAGKTTLFNVICGFVRPSAGRMEFDGKPLRRPRPHDLAKLGIARTRTTIVLATAKESVQIPIAED